ncbi:Replication factor C subunit 4 [Zancudomyces culisetae]|uniref:Replication factor C subunit 4 n=1 Tax=Zancudomyces culisetae TaxID=1213189 RepID=A0A1R1PS91_ZANCU|nr:Replication factor C subunit 4 [Zancudomyces culisetae]|eukprot:OMH83856.1 Replication factor C subunit 4 [Zancudomyces culisetae]
METYSKITRFCLVCNYVSRIIEPLTSRCAKFRFKPLESALSYGKIQEVAAAEDLKITDEAIQRLVEASNGDLRKAIMLLQSAQQLDQSTAISPEMVNDICGIVPEELVNELIEKAQGTSVSAIKEAISHVILEGYSAKQIVEQLHQTLLNSGNKNYSQFTSLNKSKIALLLGDAEFALLNGGDQELHVLNLLVQISCVINS